MPEIDLMIIVTLDKLCISVARIRWRASVNPKFQYNQHNSVRRPFSAPPVGDESGNFTIEMTVCAPFFVDS